MREVTSQKLFCSQVHYSWFTVDNVYCTITAALQEHRENQIPSLFDFWK